jgi:aminoglycoside 2'-N-acetyltransferase I
MSEPRLIVTDTPTAHLLAAARRLMDDAFDDFSDDDWDHALGGTHAIVVDGDDVVAHASVVARTLTIGGNDLHAGYVEAVATHPAQQRTGLATTAMRVIGDVIESTFEIGALSTGANGFYERLGWVRWQGPTWVRNDDGSLERTEDEDDGIMVLVARRPVTPTDPIVCNARHGPSW